MREIFRCAALATAVLLNHAAVSEALSAGKGVTTPAGAAHHDGLPLFKEQAFLDWAARKGLDRARVAELYNAPTTTDKINQARSLAQAYNVQVVPMIVVDSKFATNYERAGTHSHFLTVLDQLIARARLEQRQALQSGRNDSPPAR